MKIEISAKKVLRAKVDNQLLRKISSTETITIWESENFNIGVTICEAYINQLKKHPIIIYKEDKKPLKVLCPYCGDEMTRNENAHVFEKSGTFFCIKCAFNFHFYYLEK